MTDEQRQLVIQDATGEENTDLIDAYLEIAKTRLLNRLYPAHPGKTEVPSKYDDTLIEWTVYLLNKRGAEGETGHSEVGTSRSYESASIPDSMLKAVTPCVRFFGGGE